jgi:hypothetical protein
VTFLLEVLIFALAMFAIATICRHRIMVMRHSGPEGDVVEQEFPIQNVEDVPLAFALEIELSIIGGGEFEGPPVLFCGYRELARPAKGERLKDRFTSKNSFSFYLPRMRALDAWVVHCKTRGGAVVALSIYGYGADRLERTAYFPAIPTKLLARDIGTIPTLPAAPSLVLPVALLASSLMYCASWWFPPFWTSIHLVSIPLFGVNVPSLSITDIGLWALLMLIVFLCFKPIRQEPEVFIQPYLGREVNLEAKIQSTGITGDGDQQS